MHSHTTFDLQGLERACHSIAPTWPLDRFIAVNPFWEHVGRPVPDVSATLASRAAVSLLMPRAWYRDAFARGAFTREHLQRALNEQGRPEAVDAVLRQLDAPEPPLTVRRRVLDLRPGVRAAALDHLSRWCAQYFDDSQALLATPEPEGLWRGWRERIATEPALLLLDGGSALAERFDALPRSVMDTLAFTLSRLEVPPAEQEAYAASLLLSLNGWAAWCAWGRWQKRLSGAGRDTTLLELLAAHLAWDWAALETGGAPLQELWRRERAQWPACDDAAQARRRDDWLYQRALELAFHDTVAPALSGTLATPAAAVDAHLVFCIDVRSEVLRRHLERTTPHLLTSGFAGFFGLPAAWQPDLEGDARPQLPGLLAPRLRIDDGTGAERANRAQAASDLSALERGGLSAFPFIETFGLSKAMDLLLESFPGRARGSLDAAQLSQRGGVPQLTALDGGALPTDAAVDLAAGLLRNLGLKSFPRLVAFIGHGSSTRNNAHAAAYDCGACCGQTGELNARSAAALLNQRPVRQGLRARGVNVPDDTHFVAGLHDTTIEAVRFFDVEALPDSHRDDLARLEERLAVACHATRLERAPRRGIRAAEPAALQRAFERHAWDWSQPRPEYGLAGNAAFIIAPRALTRGVDLGGRCFLHDYEARHDDDFTVLETLLTAPMVVTHWINFQYLASMVAPERFGSGNKVLHDVVGQHLGVFEGSGGDLRIGLSRQALHDGEQWVHEPLRLSVYVAAPRAAIDGVLARHERVRHLVEHGWLFLHQLGAGGALQRRTAEGWVAA